MTRTEPTTATTVEPDASVVAKLSTLDRFLAVWILHRHGPRPGAGPR